MQHYQACKICNSAKLRVIKTYRITDQATWPWDEAYARIKDLPSPLIIRLALCRTCGFLFYLDTLSYTQMKHFYQEEARYTKPKAHKMKPGRRWELDRFLSFIKNHLPLDHLETGLDLGAGDFVALHQLTQITPSLTFEALDPSYPKEHYEKIKVHRTMMEDFTPARTYDFVTAVHILEHVGNIAAFVSKTATLVRPNGYLYVEVPFQIGPGLLLNRSASVQHVNYFSPATLTYLLESHGLAMRTIEFDRTASRHNGMTGMIRALAQKAPTTPICPSPIISLSYLFTPPFVSKTSTTSCQN